MIHTIQKLLLISSIGALHVLSAQEHYLERYAVDSEIAQVLDTHHEHIAELLADVDAGSKKHAVWQFEWLPHYYVKYGLRVLRVWKKCRRLSIAVILLLYA